MIYNLTFLESAKKEWDKLGATIKVQFKKKLEDRLKHPHVIKDRLSGMKDCYKIKLRTVGYRLVYKVIDERLVIQVVTVAKRDKDIVYKLAHHRIDK
jgi:mRNA interferase RelE/StbE